MDQATPETPNLKYPPNAGHRPIYEFKVFMLFFDRGIREKLKFKLKSKVVGASKFDDLVFEYEKDSRRFARYVEAKHFIDESKIITKSVLFPDCEADFENYLTERFHLYKYFRSYTKIKALHELHPEKGELKDLILFTNLRLEETLPSHPPDGLEFIEVKEDLVNCKAITTPKTPKFYRLKVDKEKDIGKLFKTNCTISYQLALELVREIKKSRVIVRDKVPYFLKHRFVLTQDVLEECDAETFKFRETFLTNVNLTQETADFRVIFLSLAEKFFTTNEENVIGMIRDWQLKLSKKHKRKPLVEDASTEGLTKESLNPLAEELLKAVKIYFNPQPFVGGVNSLASEYYSQLKMDVFEETQKGHLFQFRKEFLKTGECNETLKRFRGDFLHLAKVILNCDEKYLENVRFKPMKTFKDNADSGLSFTEASDESVWTFFDKLLIGVHQPNYKEIQNFINDGRIRRLVKLTESESKASMRKWINEKSKRTWIDHLDVDMWKEVSQLVDPRKAIDRITLNYKGALDRLKFLDSSSLHQYLCDFIDHSTTTLLSIETENTFITASKVRSVLQDMNAEEDHNVVYFNMESLRDDSKRLEMFQSIPYNDVYVCECDDDSVKLNRALTMLHNKIMLGGSSKNLIVIAKQRFNYDGEVRKDGPFKFSQLSEESRRHILRSRIRFQGFDVPFQDIFTATTTEALDEIFNASVIARLTSNGPMIQVGEHLKDLEVPYISRTLNAPSMKLNEDEFLEFTQNKVTLISDIAGMGKSSLCNSLCRKVKQGNKHHWVLKVTLNHVTDMLSRERYKLDKSIETSPILDILIELSKKEPVSDLESRILKHCYESGNVVLFFDGLDEISPKYFQIVNYIIDGARKVTDASVYVFTRPNASGVVKSLEHHFSLSDLSLAEQVRFLVRYWSKRYPQYDRDKVEGYAEGISARLEKWTTDKKLVGVPLLIRMTAEIFEQKIYSLEDEFQDNEAVPLIGGLKEFCESDVNIDFEKELDLNKLYYLYVLKKYWAYEKGENTTDCPDIGQIESVNQRYKSFIHQHRLLAVTTFWHFMKDEDGEKETELGDKSEILKQGLVDEMDDSKRAFKHFSLAEYFLADFAAMGTGENLKILNHNLIHSQPCFTRFLNLKLQSKTPKVISLPVGVTPDTIIHLAGNACFDIIRFFVPPVEAPTAIFNLDTADVDLINFLNKVTHDVNQDIIYGFRPIHFAAINGSIDLVIHLLEKGADFKLAGHESVTALHLASRCGHIDTAEILVKYVEDLSAKNQKGKTVLHYVTEEPSLEIVKYFIDKGARPNRKDVNGCTALHYASKRGNLDVVRFLIDNGATVRAKNKNGESALHYASKSGNLDIVKYFILKGIKVNTKDNEGCTALHYASQMGNFEIVKHLVGKGAKVSILDVKERTALHYASENGNQDIVGYLIDNGAEVNAKDNDGWTALKSVSANGNLQMVTYLIDRGAKVNEEDKLGRTALHHASREGHLDIVKHLIDKGAEVNGLNNHRFPALYYAIHHEEIKIVKYLIQMGTDLNGKDKRESTALHHACEKGNFKIVKCLVQRGADVNARNKVGLTPLHFATKNGHLESVKFLINSGAEVNTKDEFDWTALNYASDNGNIEIVEHLINRGAEMKSRGKNGWTVLHYATQKGDIEMVKYLLFREAKINSRDDDGRTALSYASEKGNLDIVKCFIDRRVKLNKKDRNGWTALHYASQKENLGIVEYLIEHGAQVNTEDSDGRNVLNYAAVKGNIDIVKCLIDKGADVNAADKNGWTALHYASLKGNLDIVKQLLDSGANISAKTQKGNTALDIATDCGCIGVFDFLSSENRKQENLKSRNRKRGCLVS